MDTSSTSRHLWTRTCGCGAVFDLPALLSPETLCGGCVQRERARLNAADPMPGHRDGITVALRNAGIPVRKETAPVSAEPRANVAPPWERFADQAERAEMPDGLTLVAGRPDNPEGETFHWAVLSIDCCRVTLGQGTAGTMADARAMAYTAWLSVKPSETVEQPPELHDRVRAIEDEIWKVVPEWCSKDGQDTARMPAGRQLRVSPSGRGFAWAVMDCGDEVAFGAAFDREAARLLALDGWRDLVRGRAVDDEVTWLRFGDAEEAPMPGGLRLFVTPSSGAFYWAMCGAEGTSAHGDVATREEARRAAIDAWRDLQGPAEWEPHEHEASKALDALLAAPPHANVAWSCKCSISVARDALQKVVRQRGPFAFEMYFECEEPRRPWRLRYGDAALMFSPGSHDLTGWGALYWVEDVVDGVLWSNYGDTRSGAYNLNAFNTIRGDFYWRTGLTPDGKEAGTGHAATLLEARKAAVGAMREHAGVVDGVTWRAEHACTPHESYRLRAAHSAGAWRWSVELADGRPVDAGGNLTGLMEARRVAVAAMRKHELTHIDGVVWPEPKGESLWATINVNGRAASAYRSIDGRFMAECSGTVQHRRQEMPTLLDARRLATFWTQEGRL